MACMLGLQKEEAVHAIEIIGGLPSSHYPELKDRKAAIAAGWVKAFDDNRCNDVLPPLPDQRLTKEIETELITVRLGAKQIHCKS